MTEPRTAPPELPRDGEATTTERTARDAAAIQAYVSAQEESQRGLDMSRPPASVSTREPKPHHIERIERGTGLRWHAADRLWIWQDVGYASLEEALADRYSARLSPPRDGEVTTQREEWEVQRYREGGWFRVALAPSIASEAEGLAERDYLRREYGRLDDFRLVRRRIEETIVESTPSTPFLGVPLVRDETALCAKCGQPESHIHHDGSRWPGRLSTNHPYHKFEARPAASEPLAFLARRGLEPRLFATPLVPSEAGGREESDEIAKVLGNLRSPTGLVGGNHIYRPQGDLLAAADLIERLAADLSAARNQIERTRMSWEREREEWAARLASRSSGDGERWKRIAHYFRDARNGWRRTARLASRSAQDRTDAQRYRFLRDNPLGLRAVDGNAKYPPPNAEQMDRYVDHAREDAAIIAEAAAEIRAARAAEGSET